jgi:hypothetical protein
VGLCAGRKNDDQTLAPYLFSDIISRNYMNMILSKLNSRLLILCELILIQYKRAYLYILRRGKPQVAAAAKYNSLIKIKHEFRTRFLGIILYCVLIPEVV